MPQETNPDTGEPVWLFPFSGMGVGDSFFIPTLRPAAMIFAVSEEAKQAKVKIKVFTVKYEGYLGIRVWRVS